MLALFAEFLEAFLGILFIPFIPVVMLVCEIITDATTRGIAVCVVAGAIYFFLCNAVTGMGWEPEDIIASCHRIRDWKLSGSWRAVHFLLKALLVVAHIAVYWAVWEGRTLGLSGEPHNVAWIICAVVTLGSLIVASCILDSFHTEDRIRTPLDWGKY